MFKRIFLTLFSTSLFLTGLAQADTAKNVMPLTVGNATVTILNDVTGEGKTDILIGASEQDIKTYIPSGNYNSVINAFLLQIDGKNILIDAGLGKNLLASLSAQNVDPKSIDTILVTHMHPDHIGGLLNENGEAVFTQADVYISEKEKAFWQANVDAKQAHTVLTVYKDKVHSFEPQQLQELKNELISGIKAIAAYGHTPGHTAFLLESNGKKLLFWGDITHVTPIQFPKPEVAVTYDTTPAEAIQTRLEILKFVSEEKIPVAGAHVKGFGYIRSGTAPNAYALEELNPSQP